jgi:hypothetical protein
MKTAGNAKQLTGNGHTHKTLAPPMSEGLPDQATFQTFTCLAQENYVNPSFLGAAKTGSISNMSFGGAWV